MRRCIIAFILCSILIATIGAVSAEEFKVGIYYDNPTSRTTGFVQVNSTYVMSVSDLNTRQLLTEFSKTGASSNWNQISSFSGIHFYPDSLNISDTWLGIWANSPILLKYISKTPITRDDFVVNIKPWTGYGAESSQSRGLYFDYVNMGHTYLVRINGDNRYLLEDLSSGAVLASGTFGGDNYHPCMDIFLEVSDLTNTTMHVKAYTTISPAPYERLFFNGTLPRQKVQSTPPPTEEPPTTIVYENNTYPTYNTYNTFINQTNNTAVDGALEEVYENISSLQQKIVQLESRLNSVYGDVDKKLSASDEEIRRMDVYLLLAIVIIAIIGGIFMFDMYRKKK